MAALADPHGRQICQRLLDRRLDAGRELRRGFWIRPRARDRERVIACGNRSRSPGVSAPDTRPRSRARSMAAESAVGKVLVQLHRRRRRSRAAARKSAARRARATAGVCSSARTRDSSFGERLRACGAGCRGTGD